MHIKTFKRALLNAQEVWINQNNEKKLSSNKKKKKKKMKSVNGVRGLTSFIHLFGNDTPIPKELPKEVAGKQVT